MNDYVKTINLDLDRAPVEDLRSYYAELHEEAENWLATEAPTVLECQFSYSADLRYRYQAYEIELPIDLLWLECNDSSPIVQAFHHRHEHLYGHADPNEPVELVSIHVKVVGNTPKPTPRTLASTKDPPTPSGRRVIQYQGKHYPAIVYERSNLFVGNVVKGPAVVDQADSTVLILAGFEGKVDTYGNIVITHNGGIA
jgi:N-methylhydantoinase A